MYYTRLYVQCQPDFRDILIAEIAEAGFDTFLELETGFEAYAENESYDGAQLEEIKNRYQQLTSLEYQFDQVEKKNWNEEWEKNYEPVIVENKCLIRAEFHKPAKQFPYEIIITPKMSFGTGHHQTTYVMIQTQMEMDHKGKRVMDAGCGTAILSVMASKLGAKEVDAFDIDEWSVVNGKENIEINNCPNITIRQGKITELDFTGTFDIILANINKNILLDELSEYRKYLSAGGQLLLSGFYEADIPDMLMAAKEHSFRELKRNVREGWCSLLLGA